MKPYQSLYEAAKIETIQDFQDRLYDISHEEGFSIPATKPRGKRAQWMKTLSDDDPIKRIMTHQDQTMFIFASSLIDVFHGGIVSKQKILKGWQEIRNFPELRDFALNNHYFLTNFSMEELVRMKVLTRTNEVELYISEHRGTSILRYIKEIIDNCLNVLTSTPEDDYERGIYDNVKLLVKELHLEENAEIRRYI